MKAHCPVYNTNRMVEEYARCFYLPAHLRSRFVANHVHSGARELAAWRRRMEDAWPSVKIVELTCDSEDRPVGDDLPVRASSARRAGARGRRRRGDPRRRRRRRETCTKPRASPSVPDGDVATES